MKTDLQHRIFNCLPAGSYNMGRLFDLLEIVGSEHVESASVECAIRPTMYINPGFAQEYCQKDEHLFLLVMHELYHVILGHTRLFERPTKLHNIVFDAIINSLLSHEFPRKEYTSFFQGLNPWDSFPGRLLRPPPGWPGKEIEFHPDASDAEKDAIRLLYGKDHNTATYHDVWEALLDASSGFPDDWSGIVLLGNHEGEDWGSGEDITSNGILREIVRSIIESWPTPKRQVAGRGPGHAPVDFLLQPSQTPKGQFMVALKRLLRRTGIYNPSNLGSKRLGLEVVESDCLTPVPQPRDRNVPAHRKLYGRPPIFYQGVTQSRRLRLRPHDVAHVYLDISGSMSEEAKVFCAALKPFHRRGEVKIHVFSTVVDTVDPSKPLDRQNLKNTMGTDIQCIVDHILAYAPRHTPKKVLLLTDGYTGIPSDPTWKELQARKVELFAGLAGRYKSDSLYPYLTHHEDLPFLPNTQGNR